MRLLRPFVAMLDEDPRVPKVIDPATLDPQARIPVSISLKLLEGAVALTGDPDLGLRAARRITRGDFDLLEYMGFSCRTAREGFQSLTDYFGLVNEATRVVLSEEDGLAYVKFENSVPLIRAALDFQLGAVHQSIKRWLRQPSSQASVYLSHEAPEDLTQYEATFAPSRLVFRAPFDGFVFPASFLDVPQATADSRLHTLLRRCAERALAQIGASSSVSHQVRQILESQLEQGKFCADAVAERLQMSRRTLSRKLDREGTGFRAILDDLRRGLSSRYLLDEDLSIAEVGARLGFAEVAAFHRAFKRWYGLTPHRYRKVYRDAVRRVY